MSQAGKTLVPLLGVLAALALGITAVSIVFGIQERDKRQAKERELRQALIENEDLEGRLEETQLAKTKAEEELTRTRKDLVQSKEDLAKAVEAQTALAKSVEDREQEIERLTKDLAQSQDATTGMTSKLTQLQTERDAMAQQITELESKVMELSDANQPTIELEKILVTDSQGLTAIGSPSAAAPDGEVVVVNREYDFIVMNLGRNHGLSVGQEFQVMRGDQVLGRVKVEKVYDELSAATILPESQKESIREGDNVRPL
jgi:predicted RNase H-like nuclease (RuvC/YqgF family)